MSFTHFLYFLPFLLALFLLFKLLVARDPFTGLVYFCVYTWTSAVLQSVSSLVEQSRLSRGKLMASKLLDNHRIVRVAAGLLVYVRGKLT